MAPAVQALQRALPEEPTNEEAHVGLMRLNASSGRSGEALRQYERLSEALSSELGAEPSASTRALREEIASGRFPRSYTHLPTQPAGPPTKGTSGGGVGTHNLPVQRTGFVGREREMARGQAGTGDDAPPYPHRGRGLSQDLPSAGGCEGPRWSLPGRGVAGGACAAL